VGTRLYVGNLPYSVTDGSLEDLFAKFGDVRSAQVVQDRDTGRSKGFGFVEMADENAARAAIAGLNDQEHDGRRMTVNEARPREERGGGGGGGYRGGGGGGGGGYRGGGGGGGGGGGRGRY
jgi:cold-inducible RNA-binding protein